MDEQNKLFHNKQFVRTKFEDCEMKCLPARFKFFAKRVKVQLPLFALLSFYIQGE